MKELVLRRSASERKLAKEERRKPRAFYSYVNKRTNSRVSVGPLKDSNGAVKTDDESMVEILNRFFSSRFMLVQA